MLQICRKQKSCICAKAQILNAQSVRVLSDLRSTSKATMYSITDVNVDMSG